MVSSVYSDYSDDESLDVHVRHVSAGTAIRRPMRQPQYVQTVRERDVIREREPRSMYQAGPIMLQPERTTLIHTRSRSRERRCSPPRQPPVVINNNNNRMVNEQSDSDDYSDVSHRHHRRRSRSRVRSHSRNSSTHSHVEDLRDKWELEKARLELEELRVSNARKTDEERMDQKFREDAELQRAKRELDEIKQRQEKERTEKRIRKEVELQRLEEERRETEEKQRREREAKEAVERYKLKEKEREEAERLKQEAFDKEYQRRLREDLLRSGLDEKAIEAVLKREKIKKEEEKKKAAEHTGPRPTYTRMSLRHLAVETLKEHEVEFEYDQEQPGCVIIKRWVPEWEQNVLWEHTRRIRLVEKKQEKVVLALDGKKHHHHRKDDETFEWVRKKERHRSKSPGLLMYLAGGRPA